MSLIVAVITMAVGMAAVAWILSAERPSTLHAVRRGGYINWIEFDYPRDWHVTHILGTRVSNSDPGSLVQLWALKPYAGLAIEENTDCSDTIGVAPPGGAHAVVDQILVGGIEAPQSTLDLYGVVEGTISLDVPAPYATPAGTIPYCIRWQVNRDQNVASFEARRQHVSAVTASIRFISDTVSTEQWESYPNQSPSNPVLSEYRVTHPPGWIVVDTATGFDVRTPLTTREPYSAGDVTVSFEPGVDRRAWSGAKELLGDYRFLRGVGNETDDGRGRVRATYIQDQNRPIRVRVSKPSIEFGNTEYWLYEQTIWAILYELQVAYGSPF